MLSNSKIQMNDTENKRLREKVAAALPAFPEEDLPGILSSVKEILQSGRLILGQYTHEFEESFRGYVGTDHAVAVNSCTTALQISLRFMGASEREVVMLISPTAWPSRALRVSNRIPAPRSRLPNE